MGGWSWTCLLIPLSSCMYRAIPLTACAFTLPDFGLLFGGDVLFLDGVGRTDFPGGSFQVLAKGIEQHLWPLPDVTVVYPGHGDKTTIGREREENPFLT